MCIPCIYVITCQCFFHTLIFPSAVFKNRSAQTVKPSAGQHLQYAAGFFVERRPSLCCGDVLESWPLDYEPNTSFRGSFNKIWIKLKLNAAPERLSSGRLLYSVQSILYSHTPWNPVDNQSSFSIS